MCCICKSAKPPPLFYCCVHLEIEALNENIGRWETTWFTFIYFILSVLIWWGMTSIKFGAVAGDQSFCSKYNFQCVCVQCFGVCSSSVVELVYVHCDVNVLLSSVPVSIPVCFCVV